MADYYYRSDVSGVGTGTLADPYREPSSGPLGPNNRYFFYSASVWSNFGAGSSGFFPTAKMLQNNVQFLAYGPSGSMPTFNALRTVPSGSWTFDAVSGTYWTTVSQGGHVVRGGEMMKMFHWPPGTLGAGGISTLMSSMPMDSFVLDYESATNRIYIRISGGISDAELQVSDSEVIMNTNIAGTGSYSGVVVEGLAFRGASRSAIHARTHTGIQLRNLNIKFCCGKRNTTLNSWEGHGIQLGIGTDNAVVDNCNIGYVYNSPIIVDPADVVGSNINGVTIQNNTVFEAGRAGIETVVNASSSNINNLTVVQNVVENVGANCSTWNTVPGEIGVGIRVSAEAVGAGASGASVRQNRLANCAIGLSFQSRSAATNIASGNLIINDKSKNQVGILLYNGTGSSTLNAVGNIVHNVQYAYDSNDTSGVPATLNVAHTTIVQSNTGFRTNNQFLSLRNSLIQGCSVVLSGQTLSVTSSNNYLASNVNYGQYVLAPSDTVGPNITFDSATNFMPASNSPVITGGVNIGSTSYVSYYGGFFGSTSVWSRCSAPYYSAFTYPQLPPATLLQGSWFLLQTSGKNTWAPLYRITATDSGGFFVFFE